MMSRANSLGSVESSSLVCSNDLKSVYKVCVDDENTSRHQCKYTDTCKYQHLTALHCTALYCIALHSLRAREIARATTIAKATEMAEAGAVARAKAKAWDNITWHGIA